MGIQPLSKSRELHVLEAEPEEMDAEPAPPPPVPEAEPEEMDAEPAAPPAVEPQGLDLRSSVDSAQSPNGRFSEASAIEVRDAHQAIFSELADTTRRIPEPALSSADLHGVQSGALGTRGLGLISAICMWYFAKNVPRNRFLAQTQELAPPRF